MKKKNYKYYTGFTKEQFDAVYIFLVPTDEDPIKWSRTVKGSKSLSTTDQLLLVLIKPNKTLIFNTFLICLIYLHKTLVQCLLS